MSDFNNACFKFIQLKDSEYWEVTAEDIYIGSLQRSSPYSAIWLFCGADKKYIATPNLRAIADKLDELNTQSQTAKE